MTHEFELIGKLRQQLSEFLSLRVGPGDDAAVIDRDDGSAWLFATDMLLDGVHFDLQQTTPQLVGRKALAVNLSDIAAMGGTPGAVVVSVAIPRGSGIGEPLHEGLFQLAEEFDVPVAGGDTNSWDGPLVINVAVTGELGGDPPLLRSGARVGDWILSTGPFGGSLDGHHLRFTPRIAEARQLRQTADVHAMIDVSDGLAADLHQILRESGVGAVLREAQIPVRDAIRHEPDCLDRALSDGEDFELLFTVSPDDGRKLLASSATGVPVFHLGEITSEKAELERADGTRIALPPRGWEHTL